MSYRRDKEALRFIGCLACVWFSAATAHNLTVRSMAMRGLMTDPVSPTMTWITAVVSLLWAAVLLWALTRRGNEQS